MTKTEKSLLAILFGLIFIVMADALVVTPILPTITNALGAPSEQAGLLITSYTISAGVFALLLGPFSDKYGRKRMINIGAVGFAIAATLCAFAPSYPILLLLRAITGIFGGLITTSCTAYVGDAFVLNRRGMAMGIVMSGFFAASVMGVPLGAYLTFLFGWRMTFFILGLIAIALAGIALRTIQEIPMGEAALPNADLGASGAAQGVGVAAPAQITYRPYLEFLRRRDTVGTIMAYLFMHGGIVGFVTYLTLWLSDHFGWTAREVGFLFMFGGLASTFGSVFAGRISDKFGRKWMVVGGSAATALCIMFQANVGLRIGVISALFVGTMLSGSFRMSPLQTIATEMVPITKRGSLLAMLNASRQVGMGLGAMVGGVIYAAYGFSTLGWAMGGISLLGTLSVLVLVSEPSAS